MFIVVYGTLALPALFNRKVRSRWFRGLNKVRMNSYEEREKARLCIAKCSIAYIRHHPRFFRGPSRSGRHRILLLLQGKGMDYPRRSVHLFALRDWFGTGRAESVLSTESTFRGEYLWMVDRASPHLFRLQIAERRRPACHETHQGCIRERSKERIFSKHSDCKPNFDMVLRILRAEESAKKGVNQCWRTLEKGTIRWNWQFKLSGKKSHSPSTRNRMVPSVSLVAGQTARVQRMTSVQLGMLSVIIVMSRDTSKQYVSRKIRTSAQSLDDRQGGCFMSCCSMIHQVYLV